MSIRRKHVVAGVLALALLLPASYAFAPLAWLVPWFITGTNLMVADLTVGITGLLTTVLWYDCNKFSSASVCNPQSTSINPGSVDAIWGERALEVQLSPGAKRENPDPSKFDDPVAGARDVTPKSSVAATEDNSAPMSNLVNGGSAYGVNVPGKGYTQASSLAALQNYYTTMQDSCGPNCHWELTDCGPSGNNTACHLWFVNVTWQTTRGDAGWVVFGAPSTYTGANCNGFMRDGNCEANLPPPVTCPAGYTKSGTSCSLTAPAEVKKPTTTPCQILYEASTKSMMIDNANPNCDGASELVSNGQFTVQSSADTSSVSVKPNGDGGFDVTQSDGAGKSTTVHTGPYDSVGGGYPITSVSTTVPAGSGDGQGGTACGIPGKPACSVAANADGEMSGADQNARQGIDNLISDGKALLENIDPDKFRWTFIPQIPTTACVNPHLQSPFGGSTLDIDICVYFNRFSLFLNAVLAVLCLYGCVREIQKAMKT